MQRCLFALLTLGFLLLPLLPARAREADEIDRAAAAREVAALLEKETGTDVRGLWDLSGTLARGGKPAIDALRGAAATASPGHRLAIGRALTLLADYTKGLEILKGVVDDEAASVEQQAAALRVIGLEGDLEEAEWLADAIDTTFDPTLKMAMAKALWNLNFTSKKKGKEVLLTYLRSTDPDLRAEGALALGEIGAADEARPVLRKLRREPSERGRSAAFLLRILGLEQSFEEQLRAEGTRDDPPVSDVPPLIEEGRWPLLDEIWHLLERVYRDPDKLDREKLEDAMAAGLTEALDPHTAYLDPELHGRMREGLDPTYGGVGAYVFNDPDNLDRFTISRPIWGGPLYRAGLRTGDIVTAIEGQSTEGLAVNECVRLLKGPPGTQVTITVVRPGWAEARDFTLARARITIPTTAYDLLPGRIGYLEILTFAEETGEEVAKILDEFNRKGIRGLIVDVRYNTGGYLPIAVDIVSEFLPKDTLIVSETRRPGAREIPPHVSKGSGAHRRQVPTVVLVNQGTASAGEILAGALQAHGRARLVGKMTFGKGSVQNPLPLATRPGEPFEDQVRAYVGYRDLNGNDAYDPGEPIRHRKAKNGFYDGPERFEDQNGNGRFDPGEPFADENLNGEWDDGEPFEDENENARWDPGGSLKVTIARYYLPDGTNLERKTDVVDGKVVTTGGLVPDRKADREIPDLWEIQAQRKLDGSPLLEAYVEDLYKNHRTLVERLTRSDRRDPSLYPGFDEFYASLDTPLEKEAVRTLVRLNLRMLLGNDLGRELRGDIVDDPILQEGLIDLFETMGLELRDVEDLAFLADLQKDAEEEED